MKTKVKAELIDRGEWVDNAEILRRLLGKAVANGYTLFGHADGSRDSERWIYRGCSVSDKCKITVLRHDKTRVKEDQRHIYSVEEVLFEEGLPFLKALVGDDAAGVGTFLLGLPKHLRLKTLEEAVAVRENPS